MQGKLEREDFDKYSLNNDKQVTSIRDEIQEALMALKKASEDLNGLSKRMLKVEEQLDNEFVTKEFLGGALHDYATKREHLALEASLHNYTLLS